MNEVKVLPPDTKLYHTDGLYLPGDGDSTMPHTPVEKQEIIFQFLMKIDALFLEIVRMDNPRRETVHNILYNESILSKEDLTYLLDRTHEHHNVLRMKNLEFVVEIKGVRYYVSRPIYMLDTFSLQTAVRRHLFEVGFSSVEELLTKYNALILQELQ